MKINQSLIFRGLLVILGAIMIFVGVNVGFGGIQTLGWQVPPDFISITNMANFQVQDNHVRFLGGFFAMTGAFMLLASTDLQKYQGELRMVFVVMFVAGLTRLSALQAEVILGSSVLVSFLAEVLLMPILFFWLPRILSNTSDS